MSRNRQLSRKAQRRPSLGFRPSLECLEDRVTPSGLSFLDQGSGQLPLYFIENQGQLNDAVDFYVRGSDADVYFTSAGATFALTAPPTNVGGSLAASRQRWAVKLDFLGANPNVQPVGADQTAAVVSYFHGTPDQWHTGLPTFGSIVYHELWPGIDLAWSGTGSQLKYTFLVQPGADPGQIQFAYQGATAVRLNTAGQLEVDTPVGGLRDDAPFSYQDVGGQRVELASAYALRSDGATGAQAYGFDVGAYDSSRPLVIDPTTLVYAGYIGGAGDDEGAGIALDIDGNAYIVGTTSSSEATFPEMVGPDLTYNDISESDAFIAKINNTGTALIYAGYIGGDFFDNAYGIAVDSSGNAYVAGGTSSDEASFPVLVGPDLTFNGAGDGFVAKVNAAGNALVYCGYIGGAGAESTVSIAVNGAGLAYVTGTTTSNQATFPVFGGPDLTYNGGFEDAFVAGVKPSGSSLEFAGYIGGSGDNFGNSIALGMIAGVEIVAVAGSTKSTQATFPVTVGPDLTLNGGFDAYVAVLPADGRSLLSVGYIGGSGDDFGEGIAVHSDGSLYVSGTTRSTEASFPVTVGPDLTYNGGFQDAFVAKVSADHMALLYAGYIGGAGSDSAAGIAVDSAGNAYVAGSTDSTEATFPVLDGPDLTYNGADQDVFVAKINASGSARLYIGYIGGSGIDNAAGIAVDSAGTANVAGTTRSSESSFPVLNGPDLTFNGGLSDAFVARIAQASLPADIDLVVTLTDSPDPVLPGANLTYTITVTNSGTTAATGVTLTDTLPLMATFVSATPSQGTATQAAGIITADLGVLASGASAIVTIVVQPLPTAPATILNTVAVTANESDTNPANNTADESTTVILAAVDLRVLLRDSPNRVLPGANLTYTIDVRKSGTTPATGVTVTDTLSPMVTFVSASTSNGTAMHAAGIVTFDLGTLAAAGVVLTIVVQPLPTAPEIILNTVTVTANETDPNPVDNTDTEFTTVAGGFRIFAIGTDAEMPALEGSFNVGPRVVVFDAIAGGSGAPLVQFLAYAPTVLGGVRVAVADVNGDGFDDIITGAGPGGGPHVKVFDGAAIAAGTFDSANPSAHELASFFAYDPGFTGGLYLAAGDVNGDDKADVITGAGAGGGPHVKVIDGTRLGLVDANGKILDTALVRSFFAYDAGVLGGVRVAAGDVDGDGEADVVTGAGIGGAGVGDAFSLFPVVSLGKIPFFLAATHVKVFSSSALTSGSSFLFGLYSFFAYDPAFTGGVYVAARDMNGDGRADIITGAGAGGGPHVRVFSGADLSLLSDFMAGDPMFRGGVRVAATDVNGDGSADILAGFGPGSRRMQPFELSGVLLPGLAEPYVAPYLDGVYVGASR